MTRLIFVSARDRRFALVVVPADYRVTGVKAFIMNTMESCYQRDLGSDSLRVVKSMELYNPDKTWRPKISALW